MAIRLALDQCGEAGVRVVAVDRSDPRRTLVDRDVSSSLSALGLDDPGVVHSADDRPDGLIEGTVLRDDVPPAEVAGLGTPGSC